MAPVAQGIAPIVSAASRSLGRIVSDVLHSWKFLFCGSAKEADMKRSQQNLRHPPAFLIAFVSLATIFMFLIGVGASIPGANPIEITMIVCACVFIFILLLILLLPTIIDALHAAIMQWEDREHNYRTKQADREHYYASRRRMRELELEQYKRQHQIITYRPRRVRRHQRSKDPTDYGC
jgi:hypothetical protein